MDLVLGGTNENEELMDEQPHDIPKLAQMAYCRSNFSWGRTLVDNFCLNQHFYRFLLTGYRYMIEMATNIVKSKVLKVFFVILQKRMHGFQ